ncbi:MAG: helix-turn-helix domain-containing protein [Steroidobacteraceae bacterium]
MDSLINAAARALAVGDPLGALKRVALRNDAPALALRGIAMAQLGDLVRAKTLLRSAARTFGTKEPVARAKCIVAETEVALAARDLSWQTRALDAARITLAAHGDHTNAAHAQQLQARRLLLIGHIDAAEQALAQLDASVLPAALRTVHELVMVGISMRRLHTQNARAALARAEQAALQAHIPALLAEVTSAALVLNTPAARSLTAGEQRLLKLDEVEALLASQVFVVDVCRYGVRLANTAVSLATRPILFVLIRMLAEAWPADVSRDALIARAFRLKSADESQRVRLRVEIGRLRQLLKPLADIQATQRGFMLAPHRADEIVVLAPVNEDEHAAVLALLADGESWSSSALALALGMSQRSVQRALDTLAMANKVQAFGRGRARRWLTPPLPGFTTTLLLPATLPID